MQKSNTYLAIALGAAVVLIGAGVIWRGYKNSTEQAAVGGEGLTASLINNASLSFPMEDKLGTIKLTDGAYEWQAMGTDKKPASGKLQILSDYTASGDLTGDGVPDTAIVVAETNGTKGVYHSVEVFKNENGEPVYAANFYLGDQIEVNSMSIQDGVLTVNYLSHKMDDYLNDPTLPETLKLKLEGKALISM